MGRGGGGQGNNKKGGTGYGHAGGRWAQKALR